MKNAIKELSVGIVIGAGYGVGFGLVVLVLSLVR